MCCEILKMMQGCEAELEETHSVRMMGSRVIADTYTSKQKFVQRNPSVQRLHALSVNYNTLFKQHDSHTPFLFHSCASQVPENDLILSAHVRLMHVARGITTLFPSCVRKSSTEVFTHYILVAFSVGYAVQKQGRSLSIKTGNHTIWHYVTEGMPLFTLSIPVSSSLMFAHHVCKLMFYMSQGSQLKVSQWLGCTR